MNRASHKTRFRKQFSSVPAQKIEPGGGTHVLPGPVPLLFYPPPFIAPGVKPFLEEGPEMNAFLLRFLCYFHPRKPMCLPPVRQIPTPPPLCRGSRSEPRLTALWPWRVVLCCQNTPATLPNPPPQELTLSPKAIWVESSVRRKILFPLLGSRCT